MKTTFPKAHRKAAYEVEFVPGLAGAGRYFIAGKRTKRVTTVLDKFPESGEGLLRWTRTRVAITMDRLLRDRVVKHPQTGTEFCYFRAEEIPGLVELARKNPDDIKCQTAEVGTAVHAFCEEWLLAGATKKARKKIFVNYMLPENVDVFKMLHEQTETKEMSDADRHLFYDKMKSYMFNCFCTFWLGAGLKYVGSEIPVGSLKYGFAGRLDILAKDKQGRLILIDLKTSKWIGPAMFAQVAAYKLGYEEMYGKKIHKCAIVQMPREWTDTNLGFGVYNVKTWRYRLIFLSLLRYWKDTEFSAADCRKECLI